MTFLSERSPSQTAALSELLLRIRAEYAQMPGLKLTAPQARRLWGPDCATCDAALDALVKAKFLSRTREGLFVLTTTLRSEQQPPLQEGQVTKRYLSAERAPADIARDGRC